MNSGVYHAAIKDVNGLPGLSIMAETLGVEANIEHAAECLQALEDVKDSVYETLMETQQDMPTVQTLSDDLRRCRYDQTLFNGIVPKLKTFMNVPFQGPSIGNDLKELLTSAVTNSILLAT